MTSPGRPDLTRITLNALFLGALMVGSFLVLKPFLGAIIWATMIVVATWPVMLWLQRKLWGRRSFAVVMMTVALLLLFVVPLTLAVATVATHSDDIVETTRSLATTVWPALPGQLVRIPIFGPTLVGVWEQASRLGVGDAFRQLQPYMAGASKWLVSGAGTAGSLMLQFLLTLLVAALMFAGGEDALAAVRQFGRKLGGKRGEETVTLAGQAIRGVAIGVGVTAFVQSLLCGAGLAIAGVPASGLLTVLIFMLCIAQVGPVPILVPATIWLFWNDATGWGIFMIVLIVIATSLDNVLRPVLMRRGADLPLLLIFTGVVGGMLAFGLVGIFVGPVVLAVAYKLLDAWMNEVPASAPSEPAALVVSDPE